ncbi:MAG: Unknown protein [uncultured Thiotrichaceae bacterium]|uniref:YecA family protein n=1 Tax=uncultured Thiotrichaceae bacterium TaxID=298394 RepID=A0A6S6SJ59_9GAMM|nr:MAG: Unknown protein [uncultured Thiotrichaceae bacterium]
MEEMIDYLGMENLLSRADCNYSAAEIHGVACGLLVVNVNVDNEVWLKQVFTERDKQNVLQNEIATELNAVLKNIRVQMQDSNLDFVMLLPDDEEVLPDRVDAMQEWTQGFLLGMSLAGLQDFNTMPDDSRELLMDFMEIGQESEFDLGEEDESEDAYVEIVEYLRMGVLLIAEEMQPVDTSQTLH